MAMEEFKMQVGAGIAVYVIFYAMYWLFYII